VVETLAYLFVGLVIWTLSEYFIHRFVFHYHPTSDFGKKIAFLMHGIHHDYPNDSKRLVMPPIMSILLSIPFIFIFKYAFGGEGASYSAFSGMVIGYLCYDMLHYAVHHARWDNPLFVQLKKHHMAHHFVAPEEGFGVSNMFWDKIFKTEIKPK
jgi:sterol desaturase/sphingolipid hydroxylase (fatty acid hydroxylase superfamily)